MIIFLLGFMGCGKSTKAKQLATKWDCPVIDLDAVIVANESKSIAEIFAAIGEEGFRKLENETLKNYDYPATCVVATGGGLPCFFDNMEWMNAHGKTVYLQMEPAQLVSRLGKREKRPLIKDMDDEQLVHFIENKLKERDVYYKQAQLVINAFDLDGDKLDQALAVFP
jgi:shikimate kinase